MTDATEHPGTALSESTAFLCSVLDDDLAMLASLHEREPDSSFLQLLQDEHFPDGLGLRLIGEIGSDSIEMVKQTLSALPTTIDTATTDDLAADFANIYLNHGIQASPLESVWIDEESLICQESMFQVRSWYERHGLMTTDWRTRPDDHLVLQLQFLSHLFSVAESTSDLSEAARFMDEHLLRWIGSFSERVAKRCATAYFASIALLTGAYCEEMRDLLAATLGEPRPTAEEIEERMKPRGHTQEPVSVKFVPGIGPAV